MWPRVQSGAVCTAEDSTFKARLRGLSCGRFIQARQLVK